MRRPTTPELRQFLIQHVEKIGFGVTLAIVAAALAGTTWVPYERSSAELLQRVAGAEQSLSENVWPDTERVRFDLAAMHHPRHAIDRLIHSSVPVSHYARLTPMLRHPIAADRSLREAEFHPVQDLHVEQGRVLVRLAPERPQPEQADQATEAEDKTEIQRPDSLTPREGLHGPQVKPAGRPTTVANEESSDRGRGYPYLSVVGVFDVEAQVRDFMPAVRRNYRNSRELFEILDFQLQRQQRFDASESWSEWREADIAILKDLINEAAGIAPDVVSADVTDSAITCPLPPRWTGVWATTATHPRLREFVLSPQEVEREMEFYRTLIESRRESLQEQRRHKQDKQGFTQFVEDPRSVREDFFAAAFDPTGAATTRAGFGNKGAAQEREREQLIQRLAREMDPDRSDRELADWIRRQAETQQHLLLFRYLDFDVEPGVSYRYRVRLKIRNPNYRKPLAAAGGLPHVVQGATRLTPWSEPTTPAAVEKLVRYFVTSIESKRSRLYPHARLNLFQYDLELGTTVQQELDVMFGRQIGGTAAARQIDPVQQAIAEKDYPFRSDDILVDALSDLRFRPQDHAGLRLGGGSHGDAGLVPYALVVTRDGKLKTIDAVSQAVDLNRQQIYLGWQSAMAADYRDPSRGDEQNADSQYEDIYRNVFGPPPTPDDQSPTGNPLRRN